ncbi:MAG TPA: prolyl oligopeptidase family serine peptidase [Pyrinomonadaceae bacterium]|nr:prolyl oligopeptidase family serine peptidase [Pyrinomonadaceae bacterium]
MHALLLSLLLGSVSGALTNAAQTDGQSGLLTRTISVGNKSYTYQVYVPSSLRGKQNVPVILFLHGIGQRGEGGFIPVKGAAAAFARQYLEKVPAVVLLPQCSRGLYWNDAEMERMVMAELEQTADEFGADAKRLYLTGVSMGGFGAWHMAAAHPEKFAAVVSICGGSPLRSGDRFAPIARKVATTPVWVFHGSDDPIVPVSESRQMVEALKNVGGNRVRYSEYEGVGHSVWFNALAERDLMPWLLAQHLD